MFADRFRVDPDHFRLEDCDPSYRGELSSQEGKKVLARDIGEHRAAQLDWIEAQAERDRVWQHYGDLFALLLRAGIEANAVGVRDELAKVVAPDKAARKWIRSLSEAVSQVSEENRYLMDRVKELTMEQQRLRLLLERHGIETDTRPESLTADRPLPTESTNGHV